MTTAAKLGAKTEFKLGQADGPPETFQKVAEVLNVGAIGKTSPEVRVTSMDSDEQEFIAGLPEGSQFEINMNLVNGNTYQEQLRAAVGTTINVQVLWPDTTQADMAVTVLGFQVDETTTEGQITATGSFRITGDITWS